MSLEELLTNMLSPIVKSIRPFDEHVAMLYAAGIQKLSSISGLVDGRRKYCVGLALDVISACLLIYPQSLPTEFGSFTAAAACFFDVRHNVLGTQHKREETVDGAIAAHRKLYAYDEVNRKLARFPVFATGAYFAGHSLVDIAKHFITGEPLDGSSGYNLQIGLSLLTVATSMYLKDTDPKLLDKEPFWKTACAYVADKVGRLKAEVPNPLPNPATSFKYFPVQSDAF